MPSESTVPARQHDVQPHSSTTVSDNISQTTFSYNQPPSTPSLKRPRSVTDELGLTPVRKRQRHFSSHKIGFNSSWATDRPWLIKLVQTDEDGESYDSMICTLCRDHNVNGANGATAWSKTGCRTLRLDKVKDHEKSSQHREATQTALAAEEMETSTRNVYTLNETATQDAFKVLQHLIENNYALSNFQSMIQLCKNTGSESLTRFSIDDESKSHTSRTVVMEMLEIYSENIRKHLLDDIQQSPAFSLMVDEVTDVTTSKHLAMCVQFLSRDGEKKTAFLADPVIDRGDAETITETIRNQLQSSNLSVDKLGSFASDGAAVMVGKKSGVSTRLKEDNPHLITNHCRDHRLALACKDSFSKIPVVKKVDDFLENLYKYYKYSSNNSSSLSAVQKAFGDKQLKVKQAKHHRWLSHDQAVTAIVRSYRSLVTDLSQHGISQDPKGHGLLKGIQDPLIIQTLFLLADILPHLASLSLHFQQTNLTIGQVTGKVSATLKLIEGRLSRDGPTMNKMAAILTEAHVTLPTEEQIASFKSSVREPFLTRLVQNISDRFTDNGALDAIRVLDTSDQSEVSALYGWTEMETLGDHFAIDNDTLLTEWTAFLEFIQPLSAESRTISALIKLFKKDLGLKAVYPNISKMLAVAGTLPLSTATVERVFSQVKLIKTDHRSSLKQSTLNDLLMVKLNGSDDLFKTLVPGMAKEWLTKKNRRMF